jgi:hypothetical protein
MLNAVGRSAIDAAYVPCFRLLSYFGPMPGCESYDLAEELFVDLAEDFDADDGEFVGRFGRIWLRMDVESVTMGQPRDLSRQLQYSPR